MDYNDKNIYYLETWFVRLSVLILFDPPVYPVKMIKLGTTEVK